MRGRIYLIACGAGKKSDITLPMSIQPPPPNGFKGPMALCRRSLASCEILSSHVAVPGLHRPFRMARAMALAGAEACLRCDHRRRRRAWSRDGVLPGCRAWHHECGGAGEGLA